MWPACSPVCPGIGHTMLFLLLFSGLCSCFYDYHFIDEPKTWYEAQDYCKEKYTYLANVDNMNDVERLIAAAGSGYDGKMWIGLHDKPGRWLWTLSMVLPNFFGFNEENFRKWRGGEPNIVIGRGILCVGFYDGFWLNLPCEENYAFLCYNNSLPDDVPTLARYFFISQPMSWSAACEYCELHHTGLAAVRNNDENEMLKTLVPMVSMAWMGLYRPSWVWWPDSGTRLFENWADGHPRSLQESCAATVINATHLGKWVGNDCDEKLHFMCQGHRKYVFHVKLTALKTDFDLNDPAVTEAMLNQFEKNMNKKGIVRDFKISWRKKPGKNIFNKEKK